MMSLTHGAIAMAGASLVLGSADPAVMMVAIIGSQIPDLDTTASIPGRILYPVADWIEQRYPHRTITHCLWASLFLAIAGLPMAYYWGNWKLGLACALGHLVSCLADTCTKEGVALFYPNPDRCVYGSNPNIRLSTGSTAEYWVLAFFTGLTIFALNLQSAGGLMVQFNQLLGMSEGAIQLYNRYGNDHHIYVDVKGVMSGDRRAVESRFFVVGQDGKRLVVQDGSGLYRTDDELIVNHISAKVAADARVRVQNLYLNDEDLFAALSQIYQGNQDAAIYLSGSLTIDVPEDIIKLTPPNQMEAIAVGEGGTVTLTYAPIEQVGRMLRGQYAVGSVEFKLISPPPEL